jgi:hypothetical protein
MRDARTVVLQRVVARNADLVFDTFIEGLKVVSNDPNYPLAQMLDDLEFRPMEDRFDLDGWLKYPQRGTRCSWARPSCALPARRS